MRQHSMRPPTELGCKKVHTITRDHAACATEGGSGADHCDCDARQITNPALSAPLPLGEIIYHIVNITY